MTPTPNNPNLQPEPDIKPNYSDAERQFLDIDKIDAWRARQHGILAGLRESDPNFMDGAYVQLFQDNVEDALDDYLGQQGLDKDAAGYGRIREIYRNASLDKVRDKQWYTSPSARGEDPPKTASERDNAIGVVRAELATNATPEKKDSLEEFKRLREAKLKAYVARLKGPVFLRPGLRKELQTAYESAQKEYEAALDKLTKEEVAKWTEDGKTAPEVEQLIADSTNARFHDDVEAQRQLLIQESGLMGQWLDKYANLSRGKKIGVTIGLGAVGLGVGFAAGLLAGAAGAVVGTAVATSASTAGMKAFGAARVYKLRQADLFKKQADLPKFEVANLGDGTNTPTTEGVRRHALDFLRTQSDKQIERGDKIKRRAVAWTVGSVAVGGAFGVLAHGVMAGEGIGTHAEGGWMQHWIEQQSQHPNSSSDVPGTNGAPYIPGEHIPDAPPSKSGGDVVKDYLKEHAAARKIDRGEGWYQTFKELGVKQGDWQELLQKVGPKLHDIRYDGVRAAYWDNNAHEWRINMTDNGKMSPEALRTIVKTANSEGFLKHSLDLSSADPSVATVHSGVEVPGYSNAEVGANPTSGAATTEAANQLISSSELTPATTVGHREGWLQTLGELKKAGVIDIPSQYYGKLLKVAGPELAKIHYSDGTPVAYYHHLSHEWRMYDSPDGGRLHPDAIRLLERLARQSGYAKAA